MEEMYDEMIGICNMRGLHAILLCFACVALADGAIAASEYIVKDGDTLWGIARNHKISYERLCELNNKPYDWCLIKVGQKIAVPSLSLRLSEERLASLGTVYESEPNETKLLNEYGNFALFSGETEADVAFNAAPERGKDCYYRNSLFVRRRTANGKTEWRLLLTSGSDWKEADGMGEWGRIWVGDIRKCFNVVNASLTRAGRTVWMSCNPPCSAWFDVVCRFDLRENTLAVLIDGDEADEEEDGTIRVKGKKFYPNDDRGAAWHDVWITPNGKIVREGKITLRGSDL